MPTRPRTKTVHQLSACAQEFMRLDYDRVTDILQQIQNHKLNYQKFFTTLVGVVASLSVAILNFAVKENTKALDVLGIAISIQSTIGLFILIASVVGVFILKNLVSIRINECFFVNSLSSIRTRFIESCQLNGYPVYPRIQTLSRNSADYVSIATCSFLNLLMLVSAISLIFTNLAGIAAGVLFGFVTLVYAILHFYSVEHELGKHMHTQSSENAD